jgi:transcription elongation factor Elf1
MTNDVEVKSEITELLKRQLQGFRCPVCAHDEFVEVDPLDQGLQSNVMLYSGDDPIPKKHMLLRTIVCTYCGRIEQFAELALRRRLEAKGAAAR